MHRKPSTNEKSKEAMCRKIIEVAKRIRDAGYGHIRFIKREE